MYRHEQGQDLLPRVLLYDKSVGYWGIALSFVNFTDVEVGLGLG